MKVKLLIPILIVVSILLGCREDMKNFSEKAEQFMKNDNQIDQREYQELARIISTSEDEIFQRFKQNDGKINDSEVKAYLMKYFTAKKIPTSENAIWIPQKNTDKDRGSFNINVFLENSQSMDGYVNGVTDFEATIHDLLGLFETNQICEELNLNYINNTIPYSKRNASTEDIKSFIDNLEPSTFSKRGGDRTTSDLSKILNNVLTTVDDQNATVLVSDFVFSPDNQNNALDYLEDQSVGIKIDFMKKLQNFDLAVAITQYHSNFNGTYYDKMDTPIKINVSRPYYIWVLGNPYQVEHILGMLENLNHRYKNKLVLQSLKKTEEPKFKILYRPRIGDFDSQQIANGVLSNTSSSSDGQTRGLFGFNVAVNYSNPLQDYSYFTEASNYELSNRRYSLKVDAISDHNDASLSGFSHLLHLQTNELKEEILKINLVGKTPKWVYNSSSIDDSNILSDQNEQQKTFGLKYLIEGVNGAFYPKSNNNYISTISITIKR